jgi:Domain of unknown function (DUF1707)
MTMGSDTRIRASDADRDRIAAALRENLADGRLTTDEFDERLDKALAAKTLGELEGLMTDLPGTGISQRTDRSPDRAEGNPLSRTGRFRSARRTAWGALFALGVLVLGIWLISGGHASPSFLWVVAALAVLVIARRITGRRVRGQRESARPRRHHRDRVDGSRSCPALSEWDAQARPWLLELAGPEVTAG